MGEVKSIYDLVDGEEITFDLILETASRVMPEIEWSFFEPGAIIGKSSSELGGWGSELSFVFDPFKEPAQLNRVWGHLAIESEFMEYVSIAALHSEHDEFHSDDNDVCKFDSFICEFNFIERDIYTFTPSACAVLLALKITQETS